MFSHLWTLRQKSIIQIFDKLCTCINKFHENFAPWISGILKASTLKLFWSSDRRLWINAIVLRTPCLLAWLILKGNHRKIPGSKWKANPKEICELQLTSKLNPSGNKFSVFFVERWDLSWVKFYNCSCIILSDWEKLRNFNRCGLHVLWSN